MSSILESGEERVRVQVAVNRPNALAAHKEREGKTKASILRSLKPDREAIIAAALGAPNVYQGLFTPYHHPTRLMRFVDDLPRGTQAVNLREEAEDAG